MTYNRRTRLAAALAGAALLTATAACGDDSDEPAADSESSSESMDASESMSPMPSDSMSGSEDSESEAFAEKSVTEIQEAVVKDMRALQFVRMQGRLRSDGVELAQDLRLSAQGDCTGTVSIDGAKARIIGIGDASYLKASEEFWQKSSGGGSAQQAQALVELIGDKWAKIPDANFDEFCDLDAFLDELDDFDASDSPDNVQDEVVGETTVNDIPAVELKLYDGPEVATAWVGSEEGRHWILKMRVKGGDDPGDFRFSEFNDAFEVKEPPKSDVLDLANPSASPSD
ncbi:hypothetical protein [Nocardioides sp. zg-DK7169]|uniref:hypothetical protein n=1 Tax=Nocardioides sp. zg-DK7169 TaxID=2736600 RepID=UPI001551D9DD|nr:hypothetical protein [Nocardioides sp. zg-DK7169]NPC98809.1 hypothetical protein [Nocardioides sp. zg-DK7169]